MEESGDHLNIIYFTPLHQMAVICPHLSLHAVVDGLAEGAGGLESVHLGGLHAAVTHHTHLGIRMVSFVGKLQKFCFIYVLYLLPRL